MNAHAYSPMVLLVIFWLGLILTIIGIVPYWKIFSKAGFSGWMSLLMVVPLVNLLVLYIVAFSDWNVRTGYQQQVAPPPVLPKHPW